MMVVFPLGCGTYRSPDPSSWSAASLSCIRGGGAVRVVEEATEVAVAVVEVVARLAAVALSTADRALVESVLADSAGVRRWLDGIDVAGARRLGELADLSPSLNPDDLIARSTRTGRRHGTRVVERAGTAKQMPELGALERGDISGEHLDVVSAALRGLQPDQRDRLTTQADRLAAIAAASTPTEFRRSVNTAILGIETDDGLARLDRQQRQVGLRWWVERDTGMIHFDGRFDPETGLALIGRLDNQVEALFHDGTPPHCPTDPLLKHHFLTAHGLLHLTTSTGRGSGAAPTSPTTATGPPRAEIIIVVDHHTLANGRHPGTHLDVGIDGIHWPIDTVRRWTCLADIVPVLANHHGTVTRLGRTQRLANAHQRRALRAMYPSCAITGCETRFTRCEIHHLHPWEHGGPTDLDNLVPLCTHHHHCAHEGRWHLALDPTTRLLAITRPDGTTTTCPRSRPPPIPP